MIDVARQREHFAGLEVNAVFHGLVRFSLDVDHSFRLISSASLTLLSFMFSVVLLINVWGGKKSGSIGDPEMA